MQMARLIKGKYIEEEDIPKWVVVDNAEEASLPKVFLMRVAALARDNNQIIYISEGFRSFERQQYFYNLYLSGKGNYAAKPDLKNGSQHQHRFAVDIGDPKGFWRAKSEKEWMPFTKLKQTTLNKYGLCIPLNMIDTPTGTREWWHLVPIEVYNSGYKGDRCNFLQRDDEIVNWEKEVILSKERMEKSKTITELISGLINKKIVTSPEYWRNVLEGKEIPKPEYLITVFQRLLK